MVVVVYRCNLQNLRDAIILIFGHLKAYFWDEEDLTKGNSMNLWHVPLVLSQCIPSKKYPKLIEIFREKQNTSIYIYCCGSRS